MDERGGHGQPLTHALGILSDELAFFAQLEEIQQGLRALDRYGACQPVHAAHELQELRTRKPVEEQRFVGHQPDALLDLKFSIRQPHAQQFD